MTLGGDLTIAKDSTVVIGDPYGDASLRLTGILTNHGTLLWQSGDINGDTFAPLVGHLVNEPDGVLDIWCDRALGSALTLENRGRIFKNFGLGNSFNCAFTNSGRVEPRAGTLCFSQTYHQTAGQTKLAGGHITITAPEGLRLLGGELSGAGIITGQVTATGGSIIPGDSLGASLSIVGDFELAVGAILTCSAKGIDVGDFGRLVVAGNATLAGPIAFALAEGFVPSRGSRFRVIASGSLSGAFASCTFPAQPADTDYFVRYTTKVAEVVAGVTSYADWQALHFGPESDPAIVGDNADPDGDGLPNLLEYAFGLEPLAAGSAGQPIIAVQPFGADNARHLTMTFTTPATVTDLALVPEASTDLKTWLSGPEQIVMVSDTTSGNRRTIVVRDALPLSASNRRFLHLRVQVQP